MRVEAGALEKSTVVQTRLLYIAHCLSKQAFGPDIESCVGMAVDEDVLRVELPNGNPVPAAQKYQVPDDLQAAVVARYNRWAIEWNAMTGATFVLRPNDTLFVVRRADSPEAYEKDFYREGLEVIDRLRVMPSDVGVYAYKMSDGYQGNALYNPSVTVSLRAAA